MPHLTLAGLSDDGKRLLLVEDSGAEHTLDVDAKLRAALRGEHARIGQLEIHMDSSLRPREIQTRIRAGEDPESVAQAAGTTVDRIMAFAAPVMAERAHVADRAQRSSVRRKSGDTGARTLGEAVEAQLRGEGVAPETVDWDAWRREDGRWTLTAAFAAGKRRGTAAFTFDARGNFVTMDDDDARWLVGEAVPRATGGAGRPRGRRLTAVSSEELPLGEDAIEMVADEPGLLETTLDLDAAADEVSGTVEEDGAEEPAAAEPVSGDEVVADAEQPAPEPEETAPAEEVAEEAPEARRRPAQEPGQDPAPESAQDTGQQDESQEPRPDSGRPPRRTPRKTRGRASVPSWDEIMFGGGTSE
jgi:hypothetical protein